MGVGRGYGKLLLFGEHAAVYGHPAVGIRLDEYLEVEISCGSAPDWSLPGLDEPEASLIRTSLEGLPGSPEPGVVRIRGTLPMSVGFGSSAAFCTGVLRAAGFPGDSLALWEAAHRLEHVFHGTPSGIDTGLSVYPGASILYPKPPALPDRAPARLPPAWLLVGALPRTSTTASLVTGIRTLRDRDPSRVDAILCELGSLSRDAASLETCPDAASLGRLADEAQTRLASLSLTTPELDLALAALRTSGSTGAKLSGAGGGGAFFGVFRDEAGAASAARILRATLEREKIAIVHLTVVRIA